MCTQMYFLVACIAYLTIAVYLDCSLAALSYEQLVTWQAPVSE